MNDFGLPQTPFVTPNGEFGFSLKEIGEITGLPIMRSIYEEFFPMESELGGEDEFRALFFQLATYFEYTRGSRERSKCID